VTLPPAVVARLDALAEEHSLPLSAAAQLGALLGCLTDPSSPTSVRDPEAGVEVHVADALSGLSRVGHPQAIADLGAGAGIPGLVIAAARPMATVVLVEATRRKAEFITSAIETTGLQNATAVWTRIEDFGRTDAEFGAVTARALAPVGVLCEYAAPLLAMGGHLVCWKGDVEPVEEAEGLAAARAVGLEFVGLDPVRPYPASQNRTLWTFRKHAETPAQFPRRAGMALKRPISASEA